MRTATPTRPLLWDLFCRVIDNYGDVGVCWRLSAQLAEAGHRVHLWVDEPDALAWMAPGALEGRWPGVTVRRWMSPLTAGGFPLPAPADVLVEAFGCEIDPDFIARAHAPGRQPPVWLNLEYLSAESWVRRSHGLPSPVMHGPARGATKHFFFPGFTADTGGLLRERRLAERQATFDRASARRRLGGRDDGTCLVSLFCYEPPALAALMPALATGPGPVRLLATVGRATLALRALTRENEPHSGLSPASDGHSMLSISYLPALTQTGYDELLWACDWNFVRGEDSLVRAIWAGQPLVWHIYPQHDDAHHAKLEAFLDWLQAPPDLRHFHRVWNGLTPGPLPAADLPAWGDCVRAARERLLAQDDLLTRLLRFVKEKG